VVAGSLAVATPGDASTGVGGGQPVPHYDHVFVIVEENHGYSDVIGNPAAPNFNALAQQYGLATAYYGVTHPSEPNYVAMLGGSTFGVKDDNPYYLNRVNKPSLISQLDGAGISWKAYLQGLPHAGYQGICYPANCNGAPDKDPLYVSKHNAIPNFSTSLNTKDWSRQVPIEQLGVDLRRGTVPAFNYVIPDECHDQHGDPPYCIDSGAIGDQQDQRLIATGDRYLGQLVSTITGAGFWAKGNNAVAIVYDEGDDSAGCCGAGSGGGRAATVVVTSHGPRGLRDSTPYNHYSLLQTIQRSFGLGCLESTCDTAHVTPLRPLFAVSGTPAVATKPLPVPSFATPTPTPNEPVSYVSQTPTSAGWAVQRAPKLGTADNTFGAVATVSPNDVWAVGNFLPDAATSNPDATLTLAAHFDGSQWKSTPTPNTGPNYNTLFGVAAVPGKAWAVGVSLDGGYQAHSLIEAWDGTRWQVAATPRLDTQRDILTSAAAVSGNDVWAVGERQDGAGRFATLTEHWDGHRWSVIPSPDPGTTGNHLYGVAAVSHNDVWAVGQRNDATSDTPLVEHWDGQRWAAVPAPVPGTAAVLDGVAVRDGELWAVGQTDDAAHAGHPLVAGYHNGTWTTTVLPNVGSAFTNLTGVTIADGAVWAAGTYFDTAAGLQKTLIIRSDGSGWRAVHVPNPGSGDNVLGAIAATGNDVWAVGYDKTASGRDPLIEHHHGD
jgi:hypothetical protein